ncbi:SOSS complex subunit C isoform X4 [Scyliorhinus canicula]|uniref:SOSS complex subunit C isoform X4 n=1 Tax=Scyliorhinus canicula TaxID=7830 RepID=UPI0018F78743|nr:SOSS complex subunit C isoform X4 [Scyliorhinus canicula]
MEFGCSTEMTTTPPAPGPTEAFQDQLKSRMRRVHLSKRSEPLIHEDDTMEDKYGCIVDRCFLHLQTCANGKFGITGDEERQLLEVRCVIEFGTCATTCFNNYKTSVFKPTI